MPILYVSVIVSIERGWQNCPTPNEPSKNGILLSCTTIVLLYSKAQAQIACKVEVEVHCKICFVPSGQLGGVGFASWPQLSNLVSIVPGYIEVTSSQRSLVSFYLAQLVLCRAEQHVHFHKRKSPLEKSMKENNLFTFWCLDWAGTLDRIQRTEWG